MTVNFKTGSAAEVRMSKMVLAMISSSSVRPDSPTDIRLRTLILHFPSAREAREPDNTKITL